MKFVIFVGGTVLLTAALVGLGQKDPSPPVSTRISVVQSSFKYANDRNKDADAKPTPAKTETSREVAPASPEVTPAPAAPAVVPAQPVTPAPAAAPQYTIAGGCEQYRGLVSRYTDWDARVMLAIMHFESLENGLPCKSDARGDGHLTFWEDGVLRGMSCGLSMVRVLRGRPTCEQLIDPVTNIEWAHKIWLSQGYGAWTIYNNGRYLGAINRY